jgi:hypothetical protein
MGSKRVGLARTQALIENLKRDLNLNGSTLTDPKGVELTKFTSAIAIPVATQDNDLWSVAIPANSLITDIGYMVSGANVNAASSTTLTFSFGDATTQQDIMAATQLNQTNSDLAEGISQSVSCANLPHASGAAMAFAPAAPLFFDTAGSVFMRITVAGAVLTDANGLVSMFVKYIIKS